METDTIPKAPKILGTAKLLGEELITKYERRESEALVRILVEFITKQPYKWLLLNPEAHFTEKEFFHWKDAAARLMQCEPIQYIIQEAWFVGLKFHVEPAVLIPRPESEELVAWIAECADKQTPISILDIGTGSGCIALGLAHFLPQAAVQAVDISQEALKVARLNSERLLLPCVFHNWDLFKVSPSTFSGLDILVSNPPYIPHTEYLSLEENVKRFEPALALEVEDELPLKFYLQIGKLGRSWLKPGGLLYFEIHADFGQEMIQLMEDQGYLEVTLKQDIQGKDRMISGRNPAQ